MFKLEATFEKGGTKGDEALSVTFTALSDKLKNMKPLFKTIVETVLVPYVRSKFREEGSAFSDAPWVELRDSTVKRRGGEAHPILDDPQHDKHRRGGQKLKDSFERGEDHVEDIEETTMVWGSRHRAAAHHQDGTRNMPARKILEINREVRAKIQLVVKAYVIQAAREAGFKVDPGVK